MSKIYTLDRRRAGLKSQIQDLTQEFNKYYGDNGERTKMRIERRIANFKRELKVCQNSIKLYEKEEGINNTKGGRR